MRLNIKFEAQSEAIDKAFEKFIEFYQKERISLMEISILKTEIMESINEEIEEAVEDAIKIQRKVEKDKK